MTQRNLKIQQNPYQNLNDIFCRNRKKNHPKIHTESQGTPKYTKEVLKKGQSFYNFKGLTRPHFKTYYKIIETKQWGTGIRTDIWTNITEQRVQKSKPSHMWSNDLQHKYQDLSMGKKQSLQQWCWEN